MVWVVSRFRLKAPPGISSSCISPLTSSGQRSRASWTSQPQKSATLSPQPGGKPRKFIRTCGGMGRKKLTFLFLLSFLRYFIQSPTYLLSFFFRPSEIAFKPELLNRKRKFRVYVMAIFLCLLSTGSSRSRNMLELKVVVMD